MTLICLAIAVTAPNFSFSSPTPYIVIFIATYVLKAVAVILWALYSGFFARPLSATRRIMQFFCVASAASRGKERQRAVWALVSLGVLFVANAVTTFVVGAQSSYASLMFWIGLRAMAEVKEHTNAATVQILVCDGNGHYTSANGVDDGLSVGENDRALVALRTWHKTLDLHRLETALQGEYAYPMRAAISWVRSCAGRRLMATATLPTNPTRSRNSLTVSARPSTY